MREAATFAFAVRRCCSPLWKRGQGGFAFYFDNCIAPMEKQIPRRIGFLSAHTAAQAPAPFFKGGEFQEGELTRGDLLSDRHQPETSTSDCRCFSLFGKGGAGGIRFQLDNCVAPIEKRIPRRIGFLSADTAAQAPAPFYKVG